MQLRPCFNQPLLFARQTATDQIYGVNAVNGNIVLVIGMKMRIVMRCPYLCKHSNYDTKKACNFRQFDTPNINPRLRQYDI